MNILSKKLCALGLMASCVMGFTTQSRAESGTDGATWPTRMVKIVVPYPAGGLTDTVSRVLAEQLALDIGQSVVVENKPGGHGQIGLDTVLAVPADGHTLALVVPATMMLLPLTQPNYHIKPLEQFAPLTIAVDTFLTLVVDPSLKARNLEEFVSYAKSHPGKLNYATPGSGSSFHFNITTMNQKLGIEGTHVPYNGESQFLTDLAGGHVQYALSSNSSKPYVEGGKVNALAVTAKHRVSSMPDVPTFNEKGVDFNSDGWVGYAAAAGTPEPVLDKVNAALVKALNAPAVKAKLENMGYSVVGNSRKEFRDLVEKRSKSYADVIRSGAIRLEE